MWAAYFRYTQYLKRLSDYHCGAIDTLDPGVLGIDPYDELRPNDADIVMGFLRYRAVTFQQRDGGLVEVQLQGGLLDGGDSSVVAGLDALSL